MVERNVEDQTLYHGDNLDFRRGMNSGTVNLIATDRRNQFTNGENVV